MKGGQNLRDLQHKKKEEADKAWIHPCVCCVCGKSCEGYYGRYGDGGVCSSKCMREHVLKPKYPGHSAEDYERNLK